MQFPAFWDIFELPNFSQTSVLVSVQKYFFSVFDHNSKRSQCKMVWQLGISAANQLLIITLTQDCQRQVMFAFQNYSMTVPKQQQLPLCPAFVSKALKLDKSVLLNDVDFVFSLLVFPAWWNQVHEPVESSLFHRFYLQCLSIVHLRWLTRALSQAYKIVPIGTNLLLKYVRPLIIYLSFQSS